MRLPPNSQTRFSAQECPLLLQFLKGRILIPHPSSNGSRTGIYFKVAQHQEFMTSFCNMGENGHSNSTALGFPSQKSNSQPQNWTHGVLILFQPLIEWCLECVWALPVGNVKQLWVEGSNRIIKEVLLVLVIVPGWTTHGI